MPNNDQILVLFSLLKVSESVYEVSKMGGGVQGLGLQFT
jgi:hypothetical protein